MEQLNQIISPNFSGNCGNGDERSNVTSGTVSESVILNETIRKYVYESLWLYHGRGE